VEAMVASLQHRGPDHRQVCLRDGAVLGHARLSIIDLESGDQPLFSADGQVAVVFNGEIYNYIELRRDLLSDYPFSTESDTEVIVALYQRYGIESLSRLNGQFAICLHDQRRQCSYLIRDRVGIAPLFYCRQGGRVLFASEVKALKAAGVRLELDPEGLGDFVHLWTPISPGTLYRGVNEVAPGSYLEIDAAGQVSVHRYWDYRYQPRNDAGLPELVEELDALLEDAVRIRLRADVPVAAYLSGGLDSSIILSYLLRLGADLETFSLSFADAEFDESAFQREVAAHFSTRHNEVLARHEQIADGFVDAIWHAESPLFRSSPVPMKLLSGRVHEAGYKVVLTGEGADEMFGGYDLFKETRIREFWSRNPESVWRPALLRRLYPYLDFSRMNSTAYLKNAFGHDLEALNRLLYGHAIRMKTTAAVAEFLQPEMRDFIRGMDIEERAGRLLGIDAGDLPLFNRAQYIEARTLMPGYILSSQGDRMLMANSVEGRYPFLDHRVIEFAGRLPNRYKMHGLKEKYLLKKLAAERLPRSVLERPKQPYRAPDINALTHPGGKDLMDFLTPSMIRRYGLFDERKIRMLLKKVQSGRASSVKDNMIFTTVLSSQIWMGQFINTH
jgi:asparagine synthase (glutamine-hydrolysing)